VDGKWNDDLMKQVRPPEPIRSGDKLGAASGTSVVR
jgi:nitrite reductase (NO-forming)